MRLKKREIGSRLFLPKREGQMRNSILSILPLIILHRFSSTLHFDYNQVSG
jgi:hypothetical protein